MTPLFREAGLRKWIGLGLGIAAAVLFLVLPGWNTGTRLGAAAAAVAVGYLGGRILGEQYAKKRYFDLLSLLYQEGNPEAYLKAIGELAARAKPGSVQELMLNCDLADGYTSTGRFDEALKILKELMPTNLRERETEARVLVQNDLTNSLLMAGRTGEAEEALEKARKLVEETKVTNPRSSASLAYNLKRYEGHLQYLKNEPVENMDFFREEYSLARNGLQKANLGLLLARFELAEARRIRAGLEYGETPGEEDDPAERAAKADALTAEAKGILKEASECISREIWSARQAKDLLETLDTVPSGD